MKTKALNLGIFLLLLMSTAGCTEHQNNQSSERSNQPSNIKKDEDSAEPTSAPVSLPAQKACPSHDDVQGMIAECQTLIADLRSIIHDVRESDSTVQSDAMKEKISAWRRAEASWKAKSEALLGDCEQLLGADGRKVHPELPLALKRLLRAEKWLEKSMNAVEVGKMKIAHNCLKRARIANRRASELLEGKLKEDSDTDE